MFSILAEIQTILIIAASQPGKVKPLEDVNIFTIILSALLLIVSIFAVRTRKKKGDTGGGRGSSTGDAELDEAIEAAGYSYDAAQDIFYSSLDPWQRDMGYCRLYDEAAAPMSMVIDCEPIYFEYANKRWLIEFWKGQYAMTTGCEIGVYSTSMTDLNVAGIFKGPFYQCVGNSDLLQMSNTLQKKGKVLFKREDKHWWLTGFILGEFSQPSELVMDLNITLKDKAMCSAFITGLKSAGYKENEITIKENTVSLRFDKPRTRQPSTRSEKTDVLIQIKNKLLCNRYQEITGPYTNLPDKINAIKKEAPELYENVIHLGKSESLFDAFKILSKFLN